MSEILLGQKVRDKITGFTGIATAHVRYLSGSPQVSVQPPVAADGKHQDALWLNVDRLEPVDDGVSVGFRPEPPASLPAAFPGQRGPRP